MNVFIIDNRDIPSNNIKKHLKLTSVWPSVETEEDKDFAITTLNELANLYDRMVMFVRWATIIGSMMGIALINQDTFGQMATIAWYVAILLIGFLSFFLPDKSYIQHFLFYWYERKMKNKE